MRTPLAPLLLLALLAPCGAAEDPAPPAAPPAPAERMTPASAASPALDAGLATVRVVSLRPESKRILWLPVGCTARGGEGAFASERSADRVTVSTTFTLAADTTEVEELARRAEAAFPGARVERARLSTFAMGLHLGEDRVWMRERGSGTAEAVPARFVVEPARVEGAGTLQWTALLVFTEDMPPLPRELTVDWKKVAASFAAFVAARPTGAMTRETFARFVAESFAAGTLRWRATPLAPGEPGVAEPTEEQLLGRTADLLADSLLDLSGPPVPSAEGPAHPARAGFKPDGLPATFDLTAGGFAERSLGLLMALPFGK